MDWLEAQLIQIEQVGREVYLAEQIGRGPRRGRRVVAMPPVEVALCLLDRRPCLLELLLGLVPPTFAPGARRLRLR